MEQMDFTYEFRLIALGEWSFRAFFSFKYWTIQNSSTEEFIPYCLLFYKQFLQFVTRNVESPVKIWSLLNMFTSNQKVMNLLSLSRTCKMCYKILLFSLIHTMDGWGAPVCRKKTISFTLFICFSSFAHQNIHSFYVQLIAVYVHMK